MYADQTPELTPIIAVSASGCQRPPPARTRSLRARIHRDSESTRTPSMSTRPPAWSLKRLDGRPLDGQAPPVPLHVGVEAADVVGLRRAGRDLGLVEDLGGEVVAQPVVPLVAQEVRQQRHAPRAPLAGDLPDGHGGADGGG